MIALVIGIKNVIAKQPLNNPINCEMRSDCSGHPGQKVGRYNQAKVKVMTQSSTRNRNVKSYLREVNVAFYIKLDIAIHFIKNTESNY
jgi:hypothetical protein